MATERTVEGNMVTVVKRAGYKKRGQGVNRDKWRKTVMLDNAKASIAIAAAKKLKHEDDNRELNDSLASIKAQIQNDAIPLKEYVAQFDARIASLQEKIDVLEEAKEQNDGFLRPGAENALKQWKNDIKELHAEKKTFMDTHKKGE